MSLNYTLHVIGGNFTRDHDLRYTQKGTAVLSNGVAVNRRWKGQDGKQQESTTFYDIKAWGAKAEALANYTTKGAAILLTCRMENESWEDKQTGQTRRRNVFIVEEFSFVESQRQEAKRNAERQQSQPKAGENGTDRLIDGDDDPSDDIPF